MSQLSAIIDAATSESTSVANLLRMVKVMAARMDTPPLIDWVENELSGYGPDVPVPDYRGPFRTQVLSEWTGPFSSIARNVPLAANGVPAVLEELGGFEHTFRESVSELERLATLEDLAVRWPTEAVGLVNGAIARGEILAVVRDSVLVSAFKVSSPNRAAAAVDNVRTRVLDLALELEKVAPDAGEPGAAPADPATVRTIITNIYGHGNAVAVDSPGARQLTAVRAGDLDGLLKAAAALGLESEEVAELKDAVEGDAADAETPVGKPGGRVKRFLGKVALGGVTIASKDTLQEGVHMLGDLVRSYYGM